MWYTVYNILNEYSVDDEDAKCLCVGLISSQKIEGFVMVDMLLRGTTESGQAKDVQVKPNRLFGIRERVSTPTLVLMTGFAGAGKTTLAQWLQPELGWKAINKDDIKNKFLANEQKEEEAGWNAFDLSLKLTEQALFERESAIVDTSNEKPFIYNSAQATLEKMGTRPMIIFCLANKAKRKERVEARGSVFYPHVKELPTIVDDSELFARLGYLVSTDELKDMLRNPVALLQQSISPLQKENVLFINTDQPLKNYAPIVLEKIRAFQRCQ